VPFRITPVVACKLRHHDAHSGVKPGRIFEGHLMAEPKVGERLFLYRTAGEQLVTTPVRRLLVEPDGREVYVETQNSVYRLTLGQPQLPSSALADPLHPVHADRLRVRARIADDGSEITFVDEDEVAAPESAVPHTPRR
jgi:hypothetical protein